MVKLLKLTTGELVVAETENLGSVYKLKNAVQLVGHGEGVAVVPMCPFSDGDYIEIDKLHVIYTTKPSEDVLNPYNMQYGSGIITHAPANILQE